MRNFSLPDHFGDIAPPAAMRLERVRRRVLDWLFAHDYQLLIPPLAEYLCELTAGDESLDLDTFKITDTLSGRTLGIRADHTPQIARYDAACDLRAHTARRFCYCGPALITRPRQPWKSRELMQLGAELYGAEQNTADWEIAHLAGGALREAGLNHIAVDVGNAALFNHCLENARAVSAADREQLRFYFSRGDIAMLRQTAAGLNIQKAARPLIELSELGGDLSTIADGKKILPTATPLFDDLFFVGEQLAVDGYQVNIRFGEIGGYGYHTGVAFAFHGDDRIVARGGRYRRDERCAAGFSIDLREVIDSSLSTKNRTVKYPQNDSQNSSQKVSADSQNDSQNSSQNDSLNLQNSSQNDSADSQNDSVNPQNDSQNSSQKVSVNPQNDSQKVSADSQNDSKETIACPVAVNDKNWRAAIAGLQKQKTRIRFVHDDKKPSPPCLQNRDGQWTLL